MSLHFSYGQGHSGSTGFSAPAAPVIKQYLFSINGMVCVEYCAKPIQAKLLSETGVIQAQVSLEKKAAIVEMDITQISPQTIVDRITEMGFEAEFKGELTPSKGLRLF